MKKFFLLMMSLLFISVNSATSVNAQNYIFGTFFTSNEDTYVQCYLSNDGVNFTHWKQLADLKGRDPSCRIYNGNLYICLVEPKESDQTFYITKFNLNDLNDTISSEQTSYSVIKRGNARNIWAPDLFIDDNGAGYVYFAKEKEGNKKSKREFDIYVSKCGNIESGIFEPAQKINLPATSKSYIDAHVLKVNGKYYMIVKNEEEITNNENKSPLMLKSNLPTFETYEEIKDWPLKNIRGYEGFSMLERDGKIFIYADNFTHKYDNISTSNYTVWVADKQNIETGPYKATYVETDDRTLRHGSLILIDDRYIEDKPQFKKFDNVHESKIIKLNREDFSDGSGKDKNFAINYLAPAPNVLYVIPNKTFVEIKNISNPYGLTNFKISLTDGAKLKIFNQVLEKNSTDDDPIYNIAIDPNGRIKNIESVRN